MMSSESFPQQDHGPEDHEIKDAVWWEKGSEPPEEAGDTAQTPEAESPPQPEVSQSPEELAPESDDMKVLYGTVKSASLGSVFESAREGVRFLSEETQFLFNDLSDKAKSAVSRVYNETVAQVKDFPNKTQETISQAYEGSDFQENVHQTSHVPNLVTDRLSTWWNSRCEKYYAKGVSKLEKSLEAHDKDVAENYKPGTGLRGQEEMKEVRAGIQKKLEKKKEEKSKYETRRTEKAHAAVETISEHLRPHEERLSKISEDIRGLDGEIKTHRAKEMSLIEQIKSRGFIVGLTQYIALKKEIDACEYKRNRLEIHWEQVNARATHWRELQEKFEELELGHKKDTVASYSFRGQDVPLYQWKFLVGNSKEERTSIIENMHAVFDTVSKRGGAAGAAGFVEEIKDVLRGIGIPEKVVEDANPEEGFEMLKLTLENFNNGKKKTWF